MKPWLVLLFVPLAGCLGDGDLDTRAAGPGGWPYPTGDEFPADLEGPFSLKEVIVLPHVRPDEITINGWVLLPDLPDGVKAPVILEMGPYFDLEDSSTGSTEMVSVQEPSKPLEWVAEGYAVAYYSVRGTGRSEGCFTFGGAVSQADVAGVVEMLASQPWANGRVGMIGLSYPGTTPWMAVNAGADEMGLAAVAVMGTIIDMQQFYITPQHEPIVAGGAFGVLYGGRTSARPSLDADAPLRHTTRMCDDTAEVFRGGGTMFYDDDHATPFWNERDFRAGIRDSSVAMFLQQGFQDAINSGHMYQEKDLWDLNPGPKRIFEGQWGHSTPPQENIHRAYPDTSYTELTMPWFDYFLKGKGTPESAGVGLVEYEDVDLVWHESTAWPPAESVPATWHLGPGWMGPDESAAGAVTFQSVPNMVEFSDCAFPNSVLPGAHYYVSDSLEEDALLAGNPTMELMLESSEPSGSIIAWLFRIQGGGTGGDCTTGSWQEIGYAGANIRFWESQIGLNGSEVGADFPVGTPTPLHIDFNNLAVPLEAGDQIGMWLSGSSVWMRPAESLPAYTIHPGSTLSLPFAAA